MNDGLGPDVTAWVCEYESGEVFVSLAQNPMNDPDVRYQWRLLTMRERDQQVAQAVAAERERCAKIVDIPTGIEAWEVIGGEEGLTMLRELAAKIRNA